jgi:hypothetical protein
VGFSGLGVQAPLAAPAPTVWLVDEEDHFAVGLLPSNGLQALLELAAELGAGDERAPSRQ